jgi:hypothetical protein
MNLKKFLRLYNKFILPTVIFIVCAGVTYYGIIPGIKSIQNLYLEQKKIGDEVASINKRIAILTAMDEETLRSQVVALMTAVPDAKYLPSVFLTLDAISQETNITVSTMSITSGGNIATQSATGTTAAAKQIGSSPPIAVKMSANGTVDQIKAFLDLTASVRRLLRVNKFTMEINPDLSSKISIDLDAFYAPLPKTLGKSSDPLTGFTANDEELLNKVASYRLISQELLNYDTPQPIIYGSKSNPFVR